MHPKSRIAFISGGDLLSAVQYTAWIDLLTVLVLLLPMVIVFRAAYGLTPVIRENTVMGLKNKTQQIQAPYIFYNSKRNMTQVEYTIMQRVRKGCGRNYIRNLPAFWSDGKAHLTTAGFAFNGALIMTLIFSTLFLFFVPSRGLFGKYMPIFQLMMQCFSVVLNWIGCWQIQNENLCFLEYVWPKVRIQTGLVVFYSLFCILYKGYEILLLDSFLRFHLAALREAEALLNNPSIESTNINIKGQKGTGDKSGETSTTNWEADSDIKSILQGLKDQSGLPQLTSRDNTNSFSLFQRRSSFNYESKTDSSTSNASTKDKDGVETIYSSTFTNYD